MGLFDIGSTTEFSAMPSTTSEADPKPTTAAVTPNYGTPDPWMKEILAARGLTYEQWAAQNAAARAADDHTNDAPPAPNNNFAYQQAGNGFAPAPLNWSAPNPAQTGGIDQGPNTASAGGAGQEFGGTVTKFQTTGDPRPSAGAYAHPGTGGGDPRPQTGPGSGQQPRPSTPYTQGQSPGITQNTFNNGQPIPMLPNGTPDYMALANAQNQYNQNNARQQYNQNNPNQYNPYGSQVRTLNPDGTYSLTQSLNQRQQGNFDDSQLLKSNLLAKAIGSSQENLNYNNIPGTPTFDPNKAPSMGQFDTSGVQGIPQANGETLNAARDALYQQQTQYLDPQFNQAQSDMESKLANQGLMPGSEAYKRSMDDFSRTKQKAYGDARNSSILAGGQEQSRLFGLGLQANQAGQANALNQFNTGLQGHQTGINDLLAQFNTGMQSRQQGVSEKNALHNAPINDLNALNGMTNFQMPTYAGATSNTIPGVDYMNAANQGFNATMGVNNAEMARQAANNAGLFNLGSTFLNSQAGQGLVGSILGGAGNLFNLGGSSGGNNGGTYQGEMNWGNTPENYPVDPNNYQENPFAAYEGY